MTAVVRRAGELLQEMAETGERASGGGDTRERVAARYADLSVTKSQSSGWQKLAELAEEQFEKRVADTKKEALVSVERTAAERG